MRSTSLALILVSSTLLAVGCAKQATQINPNQQTGTNTGSPIYVDTGRGPVAPDGTGSQSKTWSSGATGDFTPVSLSAMEDYVAQRALNAPSDYRVNLDFEQNTADGSYYGTVRLGYSDNGQWHEGTFNTGAGREPVHGRYESMYNRWFSSYGKTVFHGFFSDSLGSIIIVIDNAVDYGDGQGATTVSGSIWFKNFGLTRAPESPTKCWFVEPPKGVASTPYDCRTFKLNGTVITQSRLYPDTSDGYRKLGNFTGIDKSAAFGN